MPLWRGAGYRSSFLLALALVLSTAAGLWLWHPAALLCLPFHAPGVVSSPAAGGTDDCCDASRTILPLFNVMGNIAPLLKARDMATKDSLPEGAWRLWMLPDFGSYKAFPLRKRRSPPI